MMYIDNEVLEKMIMTMVEGFNRLEKKLDRMNRLKDCLDGDTLLDNCDLAQLLGVTQRTIARYREKGLIRYYQTDENGKNFYRSSEIQEFLRQRGKKKSAQRSVRQGSVIFFVSEGTGMKNIYFL